MSATFSRSAVNASNGALGAFGAAIRSAGRQRPFSSTATRSVKHITKFTKTSSTELDELLETIRHKIILPSYLPLEQRNQIHDTRLIKKLQSDPIIIEIDGEIFKFRHMNLLHDLPNARSSVMAAIKMFQTDEDYLNLKPLLQGLHQTGRVIDDDFWPVIARRVGQTGRVYDVIDCARSVERTGFKLDKHEVVAKILHDVQMKAVDARWTKNATRKSLLWANMVMDMLEVEAHQPKVPQGAFPMPRDPVILLPRLHLSAALVANHPDADEDGVEAARLNRYASDIVSLWPEGTGLKHLHPEQFYKKRKPLWYFVRTPAGFQTLASPLLYGLELAAKTVKDEKLAASLRARAGVLQEEVREARRNNHIEGGGRGEATYKALFPEDAGAVA